MLDGALCGLGGGGLIGGLGLVLLGGVHRALGGRRGGRGGRGCRVDVAHPDEGAEADEINRNGY